ncbi:MAG: nucleoside triphosphate pyrophosphohydrolase [Magnetospiraceae bacterium]
MTDMLNALPPMDRLLAIMKQLRNPDGGCPWDVEQTFATIAPYTIEEAYEVADAIDRADMADLRDELGDLLLQVVFHARMAEEQDAFDFNGVAQAICDKMIRRHPHVFGDVSIESAEALTDAWETLKAKERAEKADQGTQHILEGIPTALPALTRAEKLQKRAARVGFDWPEALPALDKVREEVEELHTEITQEAEPFRLEDELGDILFSAVNVARKLGIDPETALRRANSKFERRFRTMEDALAAEGHDPGALPLDTLEAAWQAAKKSS